MKYAIFQMPISLNNIGLWDQGNPKVSRRDFLPVYKGDIQTNSRHPEDILNEIFEIFNINHPKDYISHSMTCGDVVQLNNKDFYLCCSIGWHRLEKFQ